MSKNVFMLCYIFLSNCFSELAKIVDKPFETRNILKTLPLKHRQVFQLGLEVRMALQVRLGWGIMRRLVGTRKVAGSDIRDKSDILGGLMAKQV